LEVLFFGVNWKNTFDQGFQTQVAPRSKLRPTKLPEGRIMTLTQQQRYLNLTTNSFHILFHEKGVVSYGQIISSSLYIRLKETCSLAS